MKIGAKQLVRIIKRFYIRFLRIRGTPHAIALGMALGIFVGLTPLMGFHTVIAVLLASLFKCSKITAAIGVFITNPVTAPMIYPLTYQLGAALTGFSEPAQWLKIFEPDGVINLVKNSPMILVDLLVGGAIIGLPLSLAAYHITHSAVLRARRRLELRKARCLARQAARLRKAQIETQGQIQDKDREASCTSYDEGHSGMG